MLEGVKVVKKMITMNNICNKNIDEIFKDYMKYCRVKNLSDATIHYI